MIVRPAWPSEPPRAAGPGSLLRIDGAIARRAMLIDGELLLAEAAWRGDEVHLRGDERAVERMRFVLALDDDLEPFHRAHRSDPLLGRVIKARPKLRVLRTPDPFEALAWGVMFQLIDTQRAGDIAWAFTRRHGQRHASGAYAAPTPQAFANQAALEAAGLAPTQSRTLARVARDIVNHGFDRRRIEAARGIGEWTLAQLDLFGHGRYDVPLAKDVGIRNAYARIAGVRTGSVTEPEFKAVLDGYAPYQGLAAMYMVTAGGAVGINQGMPYLAAEDRYTRMPYRRCGRSGIKLPAISLGLWNRFGDDTPLENQRAIIRRAFDLGITHIDLANNYGPPPGSSETNFGRIMREDLRPYRDELIISSKAGYDMWPGPYGEWGSRKYLIASCDASLARMGLEYVDIFYSHRFDPDTPLEETIGALDSIVRAGKALYAGISSYSADRTEEAVRIATELGTPILIHQPSYSLLNRWIEPEVLDTCGEHGLGIIAFSPLGQGMLTDRYLGGIPENSRAAQDHFLKRDFISDENMARVKALNAIAAKRGQALAQLAIAWVLRDPRVTSALIGASSVKQLETNVAALDNLEFSDEELTEIDQYAVDAGINIWEQSSTA